MNPAGWLARGADRVQQRHAPLAFAVGVVKKYGDDNGGVLVANLAYCAFMSVFPLLLILVTMLILVASRDPALRQQVLAAVERQFPLTGHQLTHNVHVLHRSTVPGLMAGLLLLAWGATGLAQAGLFTMEQIWDLPGPARPGYVQRLGRAVLFLAVLGIGVIVSMLLASLAGFGHHSVAVAVLAGALAVLTNTGLYFAAFRALTPSGIPGRSLLPGAVAGGIAWSLLQAFGAFLVRHYLHSDSVYGAFATVLGLIGWIYLSVKVTVYAAEINVVLARRLWPRAIAGPPPLAADRTPVAAHGSGHG